MQSLQPVNERRNWGARALYGNPWFSLHALNCMAICARAKVLRAHMRQERGVGDGPTEEQMRIAEILTRRVADIAAVRADQATPLH